MVQAPAGGGSSGFTAANKPTPDVVTGTPPPTKSVKITPNQHNAPLSARMSAPLDLKTVERRGQPTQAKDPGPKHTRLHDIPDAPTYRPTEEEFKDPMEYMNKIAPEGRKYGIVKIIPPSSWNPEFGIDTTVRLIYGSLHTHTAGIETTEQRTDMLQRFHFRVRKQELNSVEGGKACDHCCSKTQAKICQVLAQTTTTSISWRNFTNKTAVHYIDSPVSTRGLWISTN